MNDFLEFVKNKIKNNIKVEKIKIINNSNLHKKHKSFDTEKYHLRLEIYSSYLKSLNRIKAQREIMAVLSEELKTPIKLSSNQKVELIAFLKTLNDNSFIFNPDNKYPKEILNQ